MGKKEEEQHLNEKYTCYTLYQARLGEEKASNEENQNSPFDNGCPDEGGGLGYRVFCAKKRRSSNSGT